MFNTHIPTNQLEFIKYIYIFIAVPTIQQHRSIGYLLSLMLIKGQRSCSARALSSTHRAPVSHEADGPAWSIWRVRWSVKLRARAELERNDLFINCNIQSFAVWKSTTFWRGLLCDWPIVTSKLEFVGTICFVSLFLFFQSSKWNVYSNDVCMDGEKKMR